MDDTSIINYDDGSIELYDKYEAGRKSVLITKNGTGDGFKRLLSNIIERMNLSDALSSIEQGHDYVIQIPKDFQEAFDNGEVLLNQNTKTGVIWPTLYRPLESGKREIVAQCPVVQKDIPMGISLDRLAGGLHRIQTQKQMNEMIELLQETRDTVKRIEQGQMDDRIGMLESGCTQIKDALKITSEEMRRTEIQNGRDKIYTVHGQILETLKSRVNDFEPLPEGKFRLKLRKIFNSGKLDKQREEYNAIQRYFHYYLKATYMIGASYMITGEKAAAESFFDNTRQCLEKVGFDKFTTLNLINPDNKYILDNTAPYFVDVEKDDCYRVAKSYDEISIKVTGDDLLEAINDEREEEI